MHHRAYSVGGGHRYGRVLHHPYSSKVKGSKHSGMRELPVADRIYDDYINERKPVLAAKKAPVGDMKPMPKK